MLHAITVKLLYRLKRVCMHYLAKWKNNTLTVRIRRQQTVTL